MTGLAELLGSLSEEEADRLLELASYLGIGRKRSRARITEAVRYRRDIVRLIGRTEDTHILRAVYTVARTHLMIELEKEG